MSIPEFDTYKGLERFAKDPREPENLMAFNCLCKQAETRAVWQAASNFGIDKLEDSIKLITGSLGERAKSAKGALDLTSFMDKTEEEQLAMYNKICEMAGVKVDPTT